MKAMLPVRVRQETDNISKKALQMFSDFICGLFEVERNDSFNYTATQLQGEVPTWKVTRNGVQTSTCRLVTLTSSGGIEKYVCTCYKVQSCGHPCRHIICVCILLGEGQSFVSMLYFLPRWQRIFQLDTSPVRLQLQAATARVVENVEPVEFNVDCTGGMDLPHSKLTKASKCPPKRSKQEEKTAGQGKTLDRLCCT